MGEVKATVPFACICPPLGLAKGSLVVLLEISNIWYIVSINLIVSLLRKSTADLYFNPLICILDALSPISTYCTPISFLLAVCNAISIALTLEGSSIRCM